MILEHWDQVRRIFDSIADRSAAERELVLIGLEGPLRREVEWMLSNHDSARLGQGMLDRPVPSNTDLLGFLLDAQVFYGGDVLCGRFEIRGLLGRGGMGEVYGAFDRDFDSQVAIKTVRFELRGQHSVLERFRREVQRARMVTHPNVCRVHDIFTTESDDGAEVVFSTMELLEGPTLLEEVKRRDRLPPEEALGIVQGICAGLDEAHRCGLIHRDLKSSNVILIPEAGTARRIAKITDFGLARELPSNGDSLITAIAGELSGTLAYMAPELLEGKPAGKASDIYALGVVLYRMMTGRYPFAAEADLVSAAMRLRHPPLRPRKHVPSLPKVWETAILACLETEPEFRPRTAAEVRGLLQNDRGAAFRWAGKRSARHLRRREFLILGGIGLAAASWEVFGHRSWPPPFANRTARIFVEDLEPYDGGGAVARSARNMIRVALFGLPHLRLAPPAEVASAIQKLNLGTTPLRGPAAIHVAKQLGAEILIGGSVRRSGSQTTLELRAVRAANGKVLHRSTETCQGLRGLAAAAQRASMSLAAFLIGPTLAAAGQSAPPGIPDSADADAVEEFTSGLDYFVHGQTDNAMLHLHRATELDPDFAMAWIYQATVAGTQRQDQTAFQSAKRAYALRERLGTRDLLQAQATYCNWIGDTHGCLRFQQQLVSEFPGESHLHRQIAQTYALVDMTEQAIHHARQAVELDRGAGNNYMVLASALAQADHLPEAFETIREARKANASNASALLSAEAMAFLLRGDWEDCRTALTELERHPGWDLHAREHMGRLLLLSGKLSEARDYLASTILLARSRVDCAHEDLAHYWLGIVNLLFDDSRETLLHAEALATRDPEPYYLFSFRAAAELAYLAGGDAPLSIATRKLNKIATDYPSRRSTAISMQVSAWGAARSGRRDESVRQMQQAHDLLNDISTSWAFAELLRGNVTFSTAIPLYESVKARKGAAVRWDQQAWWVCSSAQVARCYQATGRTAEAIDGYRQFLSYWGGRASVRLVREVLAEQTRLTKG